MIISGSNFMRKNKSTDVNRAAYAMVQAIADGNVPKMSDGKDPLAVALGRRGGLKGGPARAAKLSSKQLSDSARKAAQARWQNAKNSGGTGNV
jgi:hypothetical protein